MLRVETCYGCSLKTATLILLIANLVIDGLRSLDNERFPLDVLFLVLICIQIFGIYGVLEEKPAFVKPYMILQMIILVLMALLAVTLFLKGVASVASNSYAPNQHMPAHKSIITIVQAEVIILLMGVTQFYFLTVVYSYIHKTTEEIVARFQDSKDV